MRKSKVGNVKGMSGMRDWKCLQERMLLVMDALLFSRNMGWE